MNVGFNAPGALFNFYYIIPMTKNLAGEQWKNVVFNFDYVNDFRLEVSNYGRLRTFNKLSDGNILNGSMINGYPIVRLKFFTARDEKKEQQFAYLQQQINKLTQKIKLLVKNNSPKKDIAEATTLLTDLKKNLAVRRNKDLKSRTIYYHSLVHRLVAEYFCHRPTEAHSVVSHLDHNKLNNKSNNLRWMTPEENSAHQQKSPHVIAEKKERVHSRRKVSTTKLTVTKVMLLKKLLNQGKPMRTLVKQFKVTDTQILRIKRGINWGDVQAAS